MLGRFTLGLLLLGWVISSAQGAFTSIYIFGDGACTTTNNPFGGSLYYVPRYSNGRVWVEHFTQWQGLSYNSNKNWSYFHHDSSNVLFEISGTNYPAPPDVGTALFVVWASDADFVDLLADNSYSPYNSNNIVIWTNSINRFLTNHSQIITNLYGKGVRTLMIPNAVDVTLIPAYNAKAAADRAFIRQRILSFNSAADAVMSNAMATLPGLTIYSPDILKLVDDVVAHAANYGLTNAQISGHNVGVLGDPSMSPYLLNGPGTNYIFWDTWHPTAKFHMVIAEAMQREVSPLQFTDIAGLDGTNRLDVSNVMVGRRGFVEGSTNFVTWTTNFAGLTNAITVNTNLATQSVFVPASGPQQFYRMTFPFVWTWP